MYCILSCVCQRAPKVMPTYHMAKKLTDIFKTLQSLSFHFGSTLSLLDLLSVSHKHALLYTNCEVYMCTHTTACVSLSEQAIGASECFLLTWKDYRKILCHNYFSTHLS